MPVYPTVAATIAIIDDDESILDAMQMVFEGIGWSVRAYLRGEEFLAKLNDDKPDCLVLDSHLPGITGADVARSIITDNIHIPIVCLTARPRSVITAQLLNAGARVVLTKPVSANILIEHVQVALGNDSNARK